STPSMVKIASAPSVRTALPGTSPLPSRKPSCCSTPVRAAFRPQLTRPSAARKPNHAAEIELHPDLAADPRPARQPTDPATEIRADAREDCSPTYTAARRGAFLNRE